MEVILTNLTLNHDEKELELYFLQLSKDDNFKYELLKNCKGCVTATSTDNNADTIDMALRMLEHINEVMLYREKLVKESLGRKSEDINIHIYNKKFKDKLPVIQLWVDEAAALYKKVTDKAINEKLERMKYITEQIAAAGRYVGIYLINTMQRASKDEMPREIKINTLNWISFNQVDKGSSMVAIGDETSAIGLPERVFAIRSGGKPIVLCKTPYTSWDQNVQSLIDLDRIRDDSEENLNKIYSNWNTTYTKSSLNKDTKIIDKEVNELTQKLDEANKTIASLNQQISNANVDLLKTKSKLSKFENNNLKDIFENNNDSYELNDDYITINDENIEKEILDNNVTDLFKNK